MFPFGSFAALSEMSRRSVSSRPHRAMRLLSALMAGGTDQIACVRHAARATRPAAGVAIVADAFRLDELAHEALAKHKPAAEKPGMIDREFEEHLLRKGLILTSQTASLIHFRRRPS